ncbi:hypothetical protein O5624_02330 [Escherichia coli]|nr:hypothetical protein [Escherichia coli]
MIIDREEDIGDEQIISNSIPIWLQMKDAATVYPSCTAPPEPSSSVYRGGCSQQYSCCRWLPLFSVVSDSSSSRIPVRLTLYGFSNKMALDLVDSVVNRALEEEKFGVTNIPVVQDAKSGQVGINALAKKKIVDFDVNYYQSTAREISRQLIEKVICKYEVK